MVFRSIESVTRSLPTSTVNRWSFRSTSRTMPETCSRTAPRVRGAAGVSTAIAFFGGVSGVGSGPCDTGGSRPDGSRGPWARAETAARTAITARSGRAIPAS
jgi:hypothetical protein